MDVDGAPQHTVIGAMIETPLGVLNAKEVCLWRASFRQHFLKNDMQHALLLRIVVQSRGFPAIAIQ
jgi:hypothetical protein